jgi:AcrR family transcriptional regulator
VPRARAPGRLDEIVDAALELLLATGYRRTGMADVARAAGVSSGLLYTYAAGKEALFYLVVQRETGVDVGVLPLPVPTPEASEIQTLLRRALKDLGVIRSLDAALAVDSPSDAAAELAGIVGEHYDAVQRHRRLIMLVERCSLDWPELAKRFYDKGRRPFVQRLGAYIEKRVAGGYFQPVPDADVAGRFIVETVAWFANHRFGDRDGGRIEDDTARETVVQLVTAGLIGQP